MASDDRSRPAPAPRLEPRHLAWIERTGRWSAVGASVIGALVLVGGWTLGIGGIKDFYAGVEMRPNTAVGLVVGGAALLLVGRRPGWARACAAAVAVLGAVTVTEYAAGWDLGVDQLLFDGGSGVGPPGRMSVYTAAAFLTVGVAILLLDWRPGGVHLAGLVAWVVGAGAAFVLLGHIYDITSLYAMSPYSMVAVPTALAFILIAIAIGCARPRWGFTAALATDSSAGAALRTLLPPALVVPPIVGTLVLAAQRHGMLGSGEGVWLLVVATVIACVTFALATAASVQRSDTRRRAAETRLSERDRMFRTLVEQLPLITYVDALDEANTPLYVSPQIETTLGYESGEWVGDPKLYERCIHDDDRDRVLAAIARMRESGEAFSGEYRLRAKDGRWVWVKDATVVVTDHFGRPLYAQGYMVDVTANKEHARERLELERRLAHAQKLESVGQLAGGVAHDFNNVLGAIIAFTGFAEERSREHPEIASDLAQVKRAAERGADLTRQLLAFSRKDVVRTRVVDLGKIVDDSHALVRPLLGHDLALRMSLADDCYVDADPTQIQRILLNLAMNSRDAMPDGGAIYIRVEPVELDAASAPADVAPGAYISLVVADTGTGMPPDVAARVFEPFFTTKAAGEGTGLGLATVYGIVQRLNGHVELDSRLGAGTEVRLLLPAADAPGPERAQAPRPPREGSILVADDDDQLRATTTRMLAAAGHRVVEASDGIDALEKFMHATPRPELLVTDVMMPRMSGPELAEAARAVDPRLRIVFVSGFAAELEDCHDDVPLVTKPFTADVLLTAVSEALSPAEAVR